MASFSDYRYDYWTVMPEVQKVENPPFCWAIFNCEGDKIFAPDKKLPIFEEWQDAQDFIENMNIAECAPKLLYWREVIKKVKGMVREIILDLRDGSYISFPPEL